MLQSSSDDIIKFKEKIRIKINKNFRKWKSEK
jgi:hypothetical protein